MDDQVSSDEIDLGGADELRLLRLYWSTIAGGGGRTPKLAEPLLVLSDVLGDLSYAGSTCSSCFL